MTYNQTFKIIAILAVLFTAILSFSTLAVAQTASYSTTYTAPYCDSPDPNCEAITSLLENSGGDEPNNPNTIDSCNSETTRNSSEDSRYAVINDISILGTGSEIKGGENINVSFSGEYDSTLVEKIGFSKLYYTNDTTTPDWKLVYNPTGYYSQHQGSVSEETTITVDDVAGTHAVRWQIYDATTTTGECPSPGNELDVDDVAFEVTVDTDESYTPPNATTEPANESYTGFERISFEGSLEANDAANDTIMTYFRYKKEGETDFTNTTKYSGNATQLENVGYTEQMTGLQEGTTYIYKYCIEYYDDTTTLQIDCGAELNETTEAYPDIEITNKKIINSTTINLTINVTPNDAIINQPLYPYNITGYYTGTTEYASPKPITINSSGEQEHTLTFSGGSVGDGTNNLTMKEEFWDKQYFQSFEKTTTTTVEIEEPSINITRLESNDYNEIELDATINTSYEVEWEIAIAKDTVSTVVEIYSGTTSTSTTTTQTYAQAEPNAGYTIYTYIDGNLQDTYPITTEDLDNPIVYLDQTDVSVIDYDSIRIENVNENIGDYTNHSYKAELRKEGTILNETIIANYTYTEGDFETEQTITPTPIDFTGLEQNTTYQIVIRDEHSYEYSYSISNFLDMETQTYTGVVYNTTRNVTTTLPTNPTLQDGVVTTNRSTSITMEANLSSMGDADILYPYMEATDGVNTYTTYAYSPGWVDDDGYIDNNVTSTGIIEGSVTGLEGDTNYDVRMCVENTELQVSDCTAYDNGKTLPESPKVSILSPLANYDLGVTARGKITLKDAENADYYFQLEDVSSGNVTESPLTAITEDGTVSYRFENITSNNKYKYRLRLENPTTTSTPYYTFTSDYEMTIDGIWDSMLEGSSWAKILMGFVIVISVVFLGVKTFGQYNASLGTYGIMLFSFIGAIIATVINLFPTYILLIFLLGGIVIAILKSMLFNNTTGGE